MPMSSCSPSIIMGFFISWPWIVVMILIINVSVQYLASFGRETVDTLLYGFLFSQSWRTQPVCLSNCLWVLSPALHFLLLFLYVSALFTRVPPQQLKSTLPPPTPLDFWVWVIRKEVYSTRGRKDHCWGIMFSSHSRRACHELGFFVF